MMFRTLSDRTTATGVRCLHTVPCLGVQGQHTLIFSDILQGKSQSGVLPLHYSDLSKCSFAYDTQESEVIEVYY